LKVLESFADVKPATLGEERDDENAA